MKFPIIILSLSFVTLLGGCNALRYVPEDEQLYTGAKVKLVVPNDVKNVKSVRQELQTLLRPEPNTKILGVRLGLYAHYKTREGKGGFYYRFLNKKLGEEPVYMSHVDPSKTMDLIDNRLENRGFFRSEISSSIRAGKKTASLRYEAIANEPYTLASYQLDNDTLPIYQEINRLLEDTKLTPGVRFDLSQFKTERERIDAELKSIGYFNFNDAFLIFEADTNQVEDKQFNLFLRLKRDVPAASIVPYEITDIHVYPKYSIDDDVVLQDSVRFDSVLYVQDELFFKPKHLSSYLLLNRGKLYSPSDAKITSNRLSSIGTYKYVNIDFEELPLSIDDTLGQLKTNIYLSPMSKRSLRTEIQAVMQSNNFAGPALTVTYTNRNIFKGGEKFDISGSVGYEAQVLNGSNDGLTSTQLSANTDLIIPRLVFPVNLVDRFKYGIPKTKIALGFEYLDRSSYYNLYSFSSTFGYSWRASRQVSHTINPISINYVNLANTSAEFEEILDENSFLKNSFEQQFIAGLTYQFTYNQLVDSRLNAILLKVNLDLAGNTIDLIESSVNEDTGPIQFLGLEYAQYSRMEIDLQNHLRIGKSDVLVARVYGGLGYAYGNSTTMPYSKQFFSGGPYSVRAFRIRSLGPGTYDPSLTGEDTYFDQSGDIRLEANLEYRFPIISFLKGAVFMDAGNVWLVREDDELPGSQFSPNFLSELAIGTGVGVRVDIQGFVIRLDWAAPIKNPTLPAGDRVDFNLKKSILNFAIGYPF
ncbi:BamA/TamA family outer membrane protein [Reichenbachiella agarivorans]|uniref:BamA/TamA family outer membrane protein n=1 Tax=Reichenbachiella agarivorans TaxID=2979464 RepID=A0ABY6CQW8_9BACT|nr:BamA/TamA family outer membrane protein [Reichenbachiella agarivorans]UXP32749.1 BamA/TamA family outer membrane protein [Reichenbachiella agarivorans]